MIHIAFCSDINYLCWCAVPARTAIEKSIEYAPITIHFILSEGCRESPQLKDLVERLDHPKVSINMYYVDESSHHDLPVSGHGSVGNYYRLLIPDLLPVQIEKVIYLDCDLIILDSLLPLWETELEAKPLAAVSNMALFENEAHRLGVAYMDGTFNSGVLVMNLTIFRKEGLHIECLQKAKEMEKKIMYWDQDVLNILARQRWLKLGSCWNVQHGRSLDPFIAEKYPIDHPKIIHFSGNGLKPWQSNILPYSNEFMQKYHELGFDLPKSIADSATQKIKNAIISMSKRLFAKAANLTLLNPDLISVFAPAYRRIATKTLALLSEKERVNEAVQTANKTQEIVSQFFPNLMVVHGPFKGMKYPSAEAFGSAILPKLAGSYEIEISHNLTSQFLSQFTDFFDIGCAEGYYAVGAATIAPNLRVHAYDTNHHALALCSGLADLNGVANRVALGERFSLAKLNELKEAGRAVKCLLLVDCEGSESIIFSSLTYEYRHALRDCTLIIESHDFIRPGIADHLMEYFKGSHQVQRVLAVGDLLRPSIYSSFIPADCDRDTASCILAERRPAPMEWLIFQPV